MSRHKIPRVGDRITFKSATRSHYRRATRLVRRVNPDGSCEVGYHGWANFVVYPHEILDVQHVSTVIA